MTTSVNLASHLLDVYDFLPMSNRNYVVDPNFDQILTSSVAIASGSNTRSLSAMHIYSAGAGGTATAYGVSGSVTNDIAGMYSPRGGSVSITPTGNSTGTLAARSLPAIYQNIEFSQTLQGRSSTFSCWLWTGAGSVTISNLVAAQAFGTGGSPSTTVALDTPVNWVVTTTPKRFSVRVDWPSTVGKTLGTNGNDFIQIGFFLPAASTINVGTAQWQLEQCSSYAPAAGLPTAFEYRGIQAELLRTQRHYYTVTVGNIPFQTGATTSTTAAFAFFQLPITMRTIPTCSQTNSNLAWFGSGTNVSSNVVAGSPQTAYVTAVLTGATASLPGYFIGGTTGTTLIFDARL